MEATLTIGDTQITYRINKHKRARRVSLRLSKQGDLRVTIPWYTPYRVGKAIAQANKSWIRDQLQSVSVTKLPVINPEEVSLLRVKARNTIRQRLEHYNKHYQLEFHRITIRDQKTRWGSCSSNKTLSFNYRLIQVPLELLDYVVVHELCHLKEMNHSPRFWKLVAETLPHHPILRNQLRKYEKKLGW